MNLRSPAPLLLLLFLSSSFSCVLGQWTLIGDFEPGRGSDQQRQSALDSWQGKVSPIQMFFTSWDASEMNWMWDSLALIYSEGHIPIISWEPWEINGQSPDNIEILVPQGTYNSYIDTWGGQLKNWLAGPDGKWNTADDRRAYIRFAHEMNGNWYPWSAASGRSSPSDYVNMWRFVQSRLDALGLDDKAHVQWIFSGICIDVGDFKIEQYYPGDDYVDWIGLGAMNFGYSEANMGWNAPSFLLNSMIDRLRTVSHNSKPFGVTEYCSVTSGGGVDGKNQWLDDFFEVVEQKEVKMAVYFNLDKNEGASGSLKDWMMFGGVNGDETFNYQGRSFKAYSAYRENVGKASVIGSDMSLTNRWIADDLWYGTRGTAVTTPSKSKSASHPSPSPSASEDDSSSSSGSGSEEDGSQEDSSSAGSDSDSGSSSDSNSDAGSDSGSTPTPTVKRLVIYSDRVNKSSVAKVGGKTVLQVNGTTHGKTALLARVFKQEGGLKIRAKNNATVDITKFKKLSFQLKSTMRGSLVRVSDSEGGICQRWVFETRNQWNNIEVAVASLKGNCDKTDISTVFRITIPSSGTIAVDTIYYN